MVGLKTSTLAESLVARSSWLRHENSNAQCEAGETFKSVLSIKSEVAGERNKRKIALAKWGTIKQQRNIKNINIRSLYFGEVIAWRGERKTPGNGEQVEANKIPKVGQHNRAGSCHCKTRGTTRYRNKTRLRNVLSPTIAALLHSVENTVQWRNVWHLHLENIIAWIGYLDLPYIL